MRWSGLLVPPRRPLRTRKASRPSFARQRGTCRCVLTHLVPSSMLPRRLLVVLLQRTSNFRYKLYEVRAECLCQSKSRAQTPASHSECRTVLKTLDC